MVGFLEILRVYYDGIPREFLMDLHLGKYHCHYCGKSTSHNHHP